MILQIWARNIQNCGIYAINFTVFCGAFAKKKLSSVLLIFHLKRRIRFRNNPKINFPCKIFRWIQSGWRNWPKYRRKAENPKKCTLYWKIQNSKTDFLNWLKFRGKIVNYMFFELVKLLKYREFFCISYLHFSAFFSNFPVLLYMVTQLWARIWIFHRILHRL